MTNNTNLAVNNFDMTNLSQETIATLNNIKQIDLAFIEYTKLERQMKTMKAQIEQYSTDIMNLINENNLKVFTTDYFKFSIKEGYVRKVVDVDKLKTDGLYNDYLKESETKPSLHREVKDLLDV